jgi:thiol-disulfide isomerase/thioredoxin
MLVIVVICILGGLAYFAFQPSPPFTLSYTATDGTPVDLAKMRGQVVLVDFWATWCPLCREEAPDVVATYQKYHDKGFAVLGVSLDEDQAQMDSFASQTGMVWPQYFDGKGWDNAISSANGVRALPAMWLVGKDGVLITKYAGEDLDGNVARALAATYTPPAAP